MRAKKKIRALIVDDSLLFRETLARALSTDPHLEIVGTAVDSMDAMEKIKQLHPDVVTLDVEMPKVNGIEFLKKLMPEHPLPVVVVSSLPINALDALEAGAVDFVKKPQVESPSDLNAFLGELAVKIKIASAARVGQKQVLTPPAPVSEMPLTLANRSAALDRIIAIGASTGGTEAILTVLRQLPETSPGVVVVQHMPAGFTKMYAERLNKLCPMEVVEAKNNMRVERGRVIIAAGGFHMKLARDLRGYYIKSQPGEKVSGHCPSVDVLFDSVAEVAGDKAIGVILTGMGADGSKGMLKMRQKGAYTIGQDKESCVVYGMPMVAYNIGAVAKQLPLDAISSRIICHLNNSCR